jgi:hypothetical protein
MQQFRQLRSYLHVQLGHARDIAARSVEAGHKTEPDRVGGRFEDNGNDRGCGFSCEGCWRAGRCDHADPSAYQIGCHFRQSVVVPLRPPDLDLDVLVRDVAGCAQTLPKRGQPARVRLGPTNIHEPDHRHRRLLRAQLEGPSGSRAANEGNKLPSSHRPPLSRG